MQTKKGLKLNVGMIPKEQNKWFISLFIKIGYRLSFLGFVKL